MTDDAPFSVDVGGEEIPVSGWDAIEMNADKQAERTFQQELEHASMYRQCFSSNAGKYVLKDLIEVFFKDDIVKATDAPGSFAPGIRQGQATVVKRIFKMIEFANTGGGKPTGTGVPTEE